MTMEVQTFEVISHDPSRGDNALADELTSPEAVELIAQLGLDGQNALLEARDQDSPVTRNPYRLMTLQELHVYRELMPKETPIAAYRDGPIPLRVLQVAAHARESCGGLHVWHPEAGIDDPVLVGKVTADRGWGYSYYLLARWGEVLKPFDELLAKARESWIRKTRRAKEGIISTAQMELATLDRLADDHFGDVAVASVY